MVVIQRALIPLYLAPLVLAQQDPQSQPWREMQWPSFAWIFPLVCLAMMLAMLLFMRRSGGMGCMRRGRLTDGSGFFGSTGRPWSGRSTPALEILNERFARGDIDKQEYEEKKAAIASAAG